MRKLILIPICFLALAVPVVVLANGAAGGFDGVVSSIETRYHVHAERIPLMGLVSLIARGATNNGVSGMHVAEIEHFDRDVDGEELNQMVQEKLGSGWERMIRETSRKGGSQTLIFVRPEGRKMGMFVLDLDGHEMDVVQLSVNPDHLSENIMKYDHHHSDDDKD
ncbi:MAG TPA: hypothetical protein VGF82_02300 [Terracidiphilus sp.]|jgi:hypothetical protein